MPNFKNWTRWFKKKTSNEKPPRETDKAETGYTYIMSDLHGCFDELNAMLAKIGFSEQDKLILAGDYIDRGSQNYEMLCWMEQVPQNILLLRGNHEEEFLCYLELLLAVQEKRQLVIDENSREDLEHLYQETKRLIEQHNHQAEQIRVFDHYGTLEELIAEQHISMADLRRWAARMEAMPYFCRFSLPERECVVVHAGYLEQFPAEGLTGKYTCIEDFYLRARNDAYLVGGIPNGMVVAGHTPTLSKDYMMYNGGLVYQRYDPEKDCLYYDIDCGCSYRTVRANARLACLCAETGEIYYL